jgi:peptidyl-prolyl cis-trans isomerase B (cyclophilin B)
MQDGKKIVIELLPEFAPNTVNKFLKIAKNGDYDGTFFHRILLEPGVLQGGAFYMDTESPEGYSVKETGYSIKGEFANNGFEQNTLKHERGVVSMARAQDFDSGSNQFFIMAGPQPMYDGEYCGFGRVIEGMENVDAIIQFAVDNGIDNPATIKKVTVDTFGAKWPDPE